MIQSTLYFQNTICMVLHIRNFKIKSVLIMEFVKWQIKIKELWFRTHYSSKVQRTGWVMREVNLCLFHGTREISYTKEYQI